MAQIIDIQYQEKATSQPLNKRFLDITGQHVAMGFRIEKGTTGFTINLMRGEYKSSVAVTPSGARVEETTDLIDRLSLEPNLATSGLPRIDSVYLRYVYGTNNAVADYVVVTGSDKPAPNPNNQTHLLLGHVHMHPNSKEIRNADVVSVPLGFNQLRVAGPSSFAGPAKFTGDVQFTGKVEFPGSGGGAGDPVNSFIERLPMPIVAAEGQTDFKLPTPYMMGAKSLFVYVNGDLIPSSEWTEVDSKTFRFYEPLIAGAKVWAYWYSSINLYTPNAHNHDDLYYRKFEIAQRAVRFASDYFAGANGRTVSHYLGNKNYIVVSIVPTEKTNAVGDISIEKRDNEIIVYNSGTYRGMFDLTYLVKAPYDVDNESVQYADFSIESSDYNEEAGVYTTVLHKRKNGTLYMKTTLTALNVSGRFTRLHQELYNTAGNKAIETKVWALVWDEHGNVKQKTRIT